MYARAATVIHDLGQLPFTLGACRALGVAGDAVRVGWFAPVDGAHGDREAPESALRQALADAGCPPAAGELLDASAHSDVVPRWQQAGIEVLVLPAGPPTSESGMVGGAALAARIPVCVAAPGVPDRLRGVGIVHGEQMANAIRCLAHLGPRLSATQRCHLLGVDVPHHSVRAQLADIMGLKLAPRTAVLSGGQALREYVAEWDVDVLAWAVSPTGGVLRLSALCAEMALGVSPTALGLLIPDVDALGAASHVELADAVLLDGRYRTAVQFRDAFGFVQPADGVSLTLVKDGQVGTRVDVRRGQLDFAEGEGRVLMGASREGTRVEGLFGTHRPGERAIALCDAALDRAPPRRLRASGVLWPVRLDADHSIDELRRRWAPHGAGLIDAASVLEDGHPSDLPGWSRRLRLLRVARHLRFQGYDVQTVLGPGSHDETALPALEGGLPRDLRTRLRALADATDWRVLEPELLLDNQLARERLISLFDGARRQILVQTYLVDEDATSAELMQALVRAGARGVRVCLLVDSLMGKHRSLGMTNALLAQTEAAPGVELRLVRPSAAVPSLNDLKWRSHRKLVVVDGRAGVVSGRNFGQAYYRGFDEVRLQEDSPWNEVPWLDASLQVRGSVVEALGRAFEVQWLEAGGTPLTQFPGSPDAAGAPAQLVVHTGLHDAHVLEAHRALFDMAESQIVIANTFPIQLELLYALLRALERGVQVRVLVGHVRPLHGTGVPFPGAVPRELASQLVFGRLDTLVRHGAQVHACRVQRADWGVDPVLPNLHAKVITVDGRVSCMGSANLDITGGYWEDELLLIVHDPALAGRLNTALGAWWQGSPAMDPEDLAESELKQRRAWLSRRWPSVIG